MAEKKKKPSQGIAIAALLLNILILPGLGTLIGGRTEEGVIQLVLFIIGIPLCFILIGFPMIIIAWVWALISAIQLIKEAE